MTKPDVTILLTVKDEQDYIGRTLKSIFAQSYKNFLMWVVDDGSTDQTYQVIKSFKDQRLTSWRFEKNAGMTERLNWLVPQVATKYTARMDSHHIAAKNRLAKQKTFLDNNPEVAAIGSNFIRLNEQGKELLRSNFPLTHDDIKLALMEKNVFRHASMMFRTDVYKKVGLYDPYFKLAQDYDFILRVASKFKVVNDPDYLITEIYRSSNMTQKFRTRSAWEALASQVNGLTRYSYPLWQSIYLLRGLAFLGKSIIYRSAR